MSGYGLSFGLASWATPEWFRQSLKRRRNSGVRRQKTSSVTIEPLNAGLCPLQSRCRTLTTPAPVSWPWRLRGQPRHVSRHDHVRLRARRDDHPVFRPSRPVHQHHHRWAGDRNSYGGFQLPSVFIRGSVRDHDSLGKCQRYNLWLTINGGNNPSAGLSGIDNAGTLTLVETIISGNSVSDQGGGIYNNGMLTVNDTTVTGNSAGSGGGIFNAGTVTLDNTTLSDNRASSGGLEAGLAAESTTPAHSRLTTPRSATTGLQAGVWGSGFGGGIYNTGTLTLLNTAINENTR